MPKKMITTIMVVTFAIVFLVGTASAENFPNKPIRMILTHGAGGSVDKAGRTIAPYLQKYLGVNVIPENMTGAGGRRAMNYVFEKAEKDGYTIVVSAHPSRVIGHLLYQKSAKYDMREFIHLGQWTKAPRVVGANKNLFTSFKQLIDESKKRQLTCGVGGGMGSSGHIQAVLLKTEVGINLRIVPFEGGAQVNSAILGKKIDFCVWNISDAENVAGTDAVILAVQSDERFSTLPNVPSTTELGYDAAATVTGEAAWAPPGTPADRVKILADAIKKSFDDPDFKKDANARKLPLRYIDPVAALEQTKKDYVIYEKVLPVVQEMSYKVPGSKEKKK
jgi:tripartite-type tricarboxylate transporter receptor subunit TctC